MLEPNPKKCLMAEQVLVSAIVLDALLTAFASPCSSFEVVAIVTQPAAKRDRGKKIMSSPLANYALDRGFSSHLFSLPSELET